MRVTTCNQEDQANEIKMFGKWILGKVGHYNDGESAMEIPIDLLLFNNDDPIGEIITSTYPNLQANIGNVFFFEDKAILAPTSKIVHTINEYVMSQILIEEKIYLSSDSICAIESEEGVHLEWMNTEFLNDIKYLGIPNHKLVLKKGVPVMLRNLDVSASLCNGRRMVVD